MSEPERTSVERLTVSRGCVQLVGNPCVLCSCSHRFVGLFGRPCNCFSTLIRNLSESSLESTNSRLFVVVTRHNDSSNTTASIHHGRTGDVKCSR